MRLVFDAYTSFSQVLWKQVQHNSNFLGGEREDRGGEGVISVYSVRMRENMDQKNPYLDTFHAVPV